MRLPVVAPLVLYPLIAGLISLAAVPRSAGQNPTTVDNNQRGQRLEDLAWPEAERVLTRDAIVVVPLGAGSKEHGPHLRLRNDLTMAEYLTRRVLDATSIVVAPTLTYHYYPAFLEYPGSTSLSLNTARDMTADVVRTLAAYGPRRFYVLNTGISTVRSLLAAAQALATDGILLRYTDLQAKIDAVSRQVGRQQGGSHADEIETSMMLYIDPAAVDMTKAVRDYAPSPQQSLRLTRRRGGVGTYSPSGIWGDPTLATREKGQAIVEALVAGILDDIRELRTAPLPTAPTTAPAPAATGRPTTPIVPPMDRPTRDGCTAGDERSIRAIGDAFASAWANGDGRALGALWAQGGNIIHPDGVVESTAEMITINRTRLFQTREYRMSRHSLIINMVRCLAPNIAVADGKWDLRGVVDSGGKPIDPMLGLVTLVVKNEADWKIEAYRYTVTPRPSPTLPDAQKRPGIIR